MENQVLRFYTPVAQCNRVSVVAKKEGNLLKFAVARTGKKDKFIRKVGRKMAETRLNNNKSIFTSVVVDGQDVKQAFYKIAPKIGEYVCESCDVYNDYSKTFHDLLKEEVPA
jgi:hypothetical protein